MCVDGWVWFVVLFLAEPALFCGFHSALRGLGVRSGAHGF